MTPTEKAVEDFARGLCKALGDDWEREGGASLESYIDAAITIFARYPGIKGLIEGTHTMVPMDPTEAMITAGYTAGHEKLHPYAGAPAWANACYRAMLAAAEKEKGG